MATITPIMTMPVTNVMADGTPDPVDRNNPSPQLPTTPAPNGAMWEFNPNSNQYELVADPLYNFSSNTSASAPTIVNPQMQLQSLSGGMFTSEPQFTSGQQPQQQSVVQGMFPEVDAMQRALYQQKQNEAMQAQAMQYAQLNPMQQAQYGLYLGSQQLGGAIGGALGAKDPQLQMIGLTQQIAQGTDLSNPQSIYQAAQKFAQIGNLPLATAYADRAKVLQESLAKTGKETAETQKLNAEAGTRTQTISALKSQFSLNDADATAIASNPALVQAYLTPTTAKAYEAIKTGKYTPESAANYARTGNLSDLDHIDMSAKPSEDWMKYARQLGLPSKASFGAYTPEEVAKVNDLQFKQDIALNQAKAMAIKIPLGDVLDKVYLSKDREDAAKNWGIAGEAYKATVPMIDKLNKVESTIGNAFTGAGADAKLSIAKGLSAVGVKISDKATDTEIANAISAQVVQQIAKVFPGSQSNKELEQLVKSKFNVQQELPTILRLIRQARDEMLSQKITYEQGAKLPDSERTKFNASLAQGQNYMKIQQYRDFESKYRNGTISETERATAAKLKDELGL